MSVKTCRKCSVTKPVAEFFRRKAAKDGLQSHCKECGRANRRAWYRANRDSERAKFHAHYAANREQYYARNSKRRAARLHAPHEPYDRAELFARWGHTCCYCDAPAEHVEHITPISKGGADALHNVTVACVSCNLSKGARSLAEWALSWAKAPEESLAIKARQQDERSTQ